MRHKAADALMPITGIFPRMMLPTHALTGLAIAAPLVALAPEFARRARRCARRERPPRPRPVRRSPADAALPGRVRPRRGRYRSPSRSSWRRRRWSPRRSCSPAPRSTARWTATAAASNCAPGRTGRTAPSTTTSGAGGVDRNGGFATTARRRTSCISPWVWGAPARRPRRAVSLGDGRRPGYRRHLRPPAAPTRRPRPDRRRPRPRVRRAPRPRPLPGVARPGAASRPSPARVRPDRNAEHGETLFHAQ